jgi:3-hydroxyisobutyrate dehydrogenase-like beta-hydroxyacid dehydrogenase
MSDETITRFGVVGTGRMGLGLVRNLLLHGCSVRAFDPSDQALRRCAELGALAVDSVGQAVAGVQAVITCLPDIATVRTAYLDAQGIIASAVAGCLCIEMTSSHGALTREIGRHAAAHGIALVDAPMLRGAPEAWAGTVHVLLGGAQADKDRARPALAHVSERVIDAGRLGKAHELKAVNNAVTMANNAVLAEAMMTGYRLGFSPELLTDVLASGLGASRLLELYTPRFTGGVHPPTAALNIGEKDLGLFVDAARLAGASTPVLAAAHQVYRDICAQGHGSEPPSRLAELLGAATAHRAESTVNGGIP